VSPVAPQQRGRVKHLIFAQQLVSPRHTELTPVPVTSRCKPTDGCAQHSILLLNALSLPRSSPRTAPACSTAALGAAQGRAVTASRRKLASAHDSNRNLGVLAPSSELTDELNYTSRGTQASTKQMLRENNLRAQSTASTCGDQHSPGSPITSSIRQSTRQTRERLCCSRGHAAVTLLSARHLSRGVTLQTDERIHGE